MKMLSSILNKFGYTKRSTTSSPSQWFIDWVKGGAATSSGVSVNEQGALKYTPFWAAVRIISSTIAELPFIVYSRLEDGGKDRMKEHPVYKLLHERPNPYMDALAFTETRQAHVLTYGNGYAEIQRDVAGRPIALWPLLPDRVFRRIKDGVPFYEVRLPKGGSVFLDDYDVLHIKGLGFDGYTGYNVVTYHREAIGYGIAVKQYGSRFFGNDASPGGVLQHPETLSDTAAKHLTESWNAGHRGLTQAHRVAILEEGMEWKQQGVDPKSAQSLEVQKYTVDDCSRIFNMPPHMLGSMDRATFNNIAEQNMKFLTMTMLYWFRKWELECNYKLFMPSERGKLFAEILYDALLRGNIKQRYEAYNAGRTGGWLSVNDIREKENMNKIGPAGDIYLEPLNMKEAGTDPDDSGGTVVDDDDVRDSHRKMIASQWDRAIYKQINTGKSQTSYALKILIEPVNAWAFLQGLSAERTRAILGNIIKEGMQLNQEIKSEILTDRIMQEIGDNHA